jgi:uncharacterized repeat protein (TIGR03803 family)
MKLAVKGGVMHWTRFLTPAWAAVALVVLSLMLSSDTWAASKFKTLHSLSGYTYAGVTLDPVGNLYGAMVGGGVYGQGTVFELTPSSNGRWAEHVLHDFTGGKDGAAPYASPIFDAAGNLYGTTRYGGVSGNGTVFEMTPDSNGQWTERVLHQFTGGKDGGQPWSGLILDSRGNLYGTTSGGGNSSDCAYSSCGVVFELTPSANGDWKEKVLHAFTGKDGGSPLASLVFDGEGNLYGTTEWDSVYLGGTVFQLAHDSKGGGWTEHVLHRFSRGRDGAHPVAGLILSAASHLYGTTEFGGELGACGGGGCGVVFELTHISNGHWTQHVLYKFTGGTDGAVPLASLTFDPAGNLYSTASEGGAYSGGTVFELTRDRGGKWTQHVLHEFTLGKGAGAPNSPLILDSASDLYGTTLVGGSYGKGTVFELTH